MPIFRCYICEDEQPYFKKTFGSDNERAKFLQDQHTALRVDSIIQVVVVNVPKVLLDKRHVEGRKKNRKKKKEAEM